MEMHQVRYFLAVSETLNFTRAAEQCHVSQPALTKAIKRLEEELGGELFRRERNLTHLTDLGRLMKPHLEAIVSADQAARAEAEDFHSMGRARLRLGVMSTVGPVEMVGFLDRLREEVPRLELQITEAPGPELVEALLRGELDVGLIGLPSLPERLDAVPLYGERYTIAFYGGHRFEAMNAVPLRELDGEDYLLRLHCEFKDHFQALGAEKSWQVNLRYSSAREDWIQAMVLAKLGCSIMPEFLPSLPGIATRVLIEPEVNRTVSLVTVAGRQYSPVMSVLIRLARRYPWRGLHVAAGIGGERVAHDLFGAHQVPLLQPRGA